MFLRISEDCSKENANSSDISLAHPVRQVKFLPFCRKESTDFRCFGNLPGAKNRDAFREIPKKQTKGALGP